jgi:hypothetical protein
VRECISARAQGKGRSVFKSRLCWLSYLQLESQSRPRTGKEDSTERLSDRLPPSFLSLPAPRLRGNHLSPQTKMMSSHSCRNRLLRCWLRSTADALRRGRRCKVSGGRWRRRRSRPGGRATPGRSAARPSVDIDAGPYPADRQPAGGGAAVTRPPSSCFSGSGEERLGTTPFGGRPVPFGPMHLGVGERAAALRPLNNRPVPAPHTVLLECGRPPGVAYPPGAARAGQRTSFVFAFARPPVCVGWSPAAGDG